MRPDDFDDGIVQTTFSDPLRTMDDALSSVFDPTQAAITTGIVVTNLPEINTGGED